MTKANKERGELSVRLAGVDYVLRPDHTALYVIDDAVGGIIGFAVKAHHDGVISMRTIALIIAEGMRAQGRATNSPALQATNDDVIRRLVFAEGRAAELMQTAIEFIALALTGGVEQTGNAAAAGG